MNLINLMNHLRMISHAGSNLGNSEITSWESFSGNVEVRTMLDNAHCKASMQDKQKQDPINKMAAGCCCHIAGEAIEIHGNPEISKP